MIALAVSTPASAQKIAPEAAFGAREAVGSASLSPNGDRIAFLAPGKGQGDTLFTAPVDGSTPPRPALLTDGNPERIRSCGWVSDARLVCRVSAKRALVGRVYTATRVIAVNSDGSDQKLLSRRTDPNARYFNLAGGGVVDWLPGQDGAVLMMRSYVPAERIGSLITQDKQGSGVDRVDTVTLDAKRIIAPNPAAAEYISDGLGNIRIMGNFAMKGDGYTTGVYRYYYRLPGKTEWLSLGNYDVYKRDGFNPYAVDPAENAVYGLQKKDGRLALYKRSLDGAMREELVYARPDVDVDDIIRIGRKNRIVGLSFATDRRQAYFFDPTLAAIAKTLGKALPGNPAVYFEGASTDEQKLLIWVGSDVDPGCHYLFDRKTKQLKRLLLSRPELAGYTLATVKSVMVRAADGTQIPAYLTLPPGSTGKHLPAIVMPHGGPDSRDEWGFDWLSQYFANRGYAVIQPNFRGSGGYGDAWYEKNGFQSWRTAIGDVDDAGRWLVSEGIADSAKLAIAAGPTAAMPHFSRACSRPICSRRSSRSRPSPIWVI
jgi:dipeptidyl aminopeptidase/acylaminoacyl peptidase